LWHHVAAWRRHGYETANLLQSELGLIFEETSMKSTHLPRVIASLAVTATFGVYAVQASADTLATHQLSTVNATNAPTRGMNMSQVEKRYGAPSDKLPVAGGDTARHPPINRWVYPGYTVYFERNIVLTSVALRSNSTDYNGQ